MLACFVDLHELFHSSNYETKVLRIINSMSVRLLLFQALCLLQLHCAQAIDSFVARDGQSFLKAVQSWGRSGEDTVILLASDIVDLQDASQVMPEVSNYGSAAFSSGTLTITGGDKGDAILDLAFRSNIAQMQLSGSASVRFVNLTTINSCISVADLSSINYNLSTALSLDLFAVPPDFTRYSYLNYTAVTRQVDWLRVVYLSVASASSFPAVVRPIRQLVSKLPEIGLGEHFHVTAMQQDAVVQASYGLPLTNFVNVTFITMPGSGLSSFSAQQRQLIQSFVKTPQWCANRTTLSPELATQQYDAHLAPLFLTNSSAAFATAMARADNYTTYELQSTLGFIPIVMLVHNITVLRDEATQQPFHVHGVLLIAGPTLNSPVKDLHPVLDLGGATEPVIQVTSGSTLLLESLVIKGLSTQQAERGASGFPLRGIQLGAYSSDPGNVNLTAPLQLYDVCVHLPIPDYLALLDLGLSTVDKKRRLSMCMSKEAAASRTYFIPKIISLQGLKYQQDQIPTAGFTVQLFEAFGVTGQELCFLPERPLTSDESRMMTSCSEPVNDEADVRTAIAIAVPVSIVGAVVFVIVVVILPHRSIDFEENERHRQDIAAKKLRANAPRLETIEEGALEGVSSQSTHNGSANRPHAATTHALRHEPPHDAGNARRQMLPLLAAGPGMGSAAVVAMPPSFAGAPGSSRFTSRLYLTTLAEGERRAAKVNDSIVGASTDDIDPRIFGAAISSLTTGRPVIPGLIPGRPYFNREDSPASSYLCSTFEIEPVDSCTSYAATTNRTACKSATSQEAQPIVQLDIASETGQMPLGSSGADKANNQRQKQQTQQQQLLSDDVVNMDEVALEVSPGESSHTDRFKVVKEHPNEAVVEILDVPEHKETQKNGTERLDMNCHHHQRQQDDGRLGTEPFLDSLQYSIGTQGALRRCSMDQGYLDTQFYARQQQQQQQAQAPRVLSKPKSVISLLLDKHGLHSSSHHGPDSENKSSTFTSSSAEYLKSRTDPGFVTGKSSASSNRPQAEDSFVSATSRLQMSKIEMTTPERSGHRKTQGSENAPNESDAGNGVVSVNADLDSDNEQYHDAEPGQTAVDSHDSSPLHSAIDGLETIKLQSQVIAGKGAADVGVMYPGHSASTPPTYSAWAQIVASKAVDKSDMNQVAIRDVLGKGSTSIVYVGVWKNLRVAVKMRMFDMELPDDVAVSNSGQLVALAAASHVKGDAWRYPPAIREAAIAASVGHANLVSTFCYDVKRVSTVDVQTTGLQVEEKFGAEGEASRQKRGSMSTYKLILVQELCHCDLRSVLNNKILEVEGTPYIDEECLLNLVLDICCGLEYLHRYSVIHGDLKPENTLLITDNSTSTGVTAKLSDFGGAYILHQHVSHLTGVMTGSPWYMAPEVATGTRMSYAADIYSLGIMMWEMYSGESPYVTCGDTCVRHPNFGEFRHRPERHPRPVVKVLMARCLAEDPLLRPTASDMKRCLAHELQQLSMEKKHMQTGPDTSNRRRF